MSAASRPGRRGRRLLGAVLAVAVGVGAAACSAFDREPDEGADAPAPAATGTTADPVVVDFCVVFPTRDATLMLEAGDDPMLEGNTQVADDLLEMAADSVGDEVPEDLRPAVDVYVSALRGYQPGVDPLSDPETAAAVDEINAWLAVHCGPPPATTPPGSTG